jgi:hypothetical protein
MSSASALPTTDGTVAVVTHDPSSSPVRRTVVASTWSSEARGTLAACALRRDRVVDRRSALRPDRRGLVCEGFGGAHE